MKKIILFTLLLLFILNGCSSYKASVLSLDEAKIKTENFINDNLMQGAPTKATVTEIIEESGLYKAVVDPGNGQMVDAYLTKDGTKLFPQAMDIEEIENATKEMADKEAEQNKDIPKQDKPSVKLFVMSYCPYGTQIEKGFLPVLKALGDKIDFNLEFCDYVMHGEKELKENLSQHCIEKLAPDKLTDYLGCFLKDGKSDDCLADININKSKLEGCIADIDKTYKVMDNFTNKVDWKGNFPTFNLFKEDVEKYGVQGSPTLVINDKLVSASRDSAGLLKIICSGFTEEPEECSTELSATAPSPGFGFEGTGSNNDASCS